MLVLELYFIYINKTDIYLFRERERMRDLIDIYVLGVMPKLKRWVEDSHNSGTLYSVDESLLMFHLYKYSGRKERKKEGQEGGRKEEREGEQARSSKAVCTMGYLNLWEQHEEELAKLTWHSYCGHMLQYIF